MTNCKVTNTNGVNMVYREIKLSGKLGKIIVLKPGDSMELNIRSGQELTDDGINECWIGLQSEFEKVHGKP